MDTKLTETIQTWLNAPTETRSLEEGAMLVLKLTGNRFMYQNIIARKDTKMIEYQLSKYLPIRLQKLTHEQITEMKRQAAVIAETHHLDTTRKPANKKKAHQKFAVFGERKNGGDLKRTESVSVSQASSDAADEWKKGKRADHDSLPDTIQALYSENLNLLHRMRECHLQVRKIALSDKPCTDCDIYPFVKELIDLDKRYHANWQTYDEYGRE